MNKTKKNFGEFIYNKRISSNVGLREFCKTKGYQSSYVSRLENGLIKAPENFEKLEALAIALEIKKNTREWVAFFDLAAASKKSIPKDIENQFKHIEQFLPAFYRTLRKKKINKKDIEKLLKVLRKTNQ